MNYAFEICANSAESCVAAQEGGATQLSAELAQKVVWLHRKAEPTA